jgi:pimeloyl-ACP methyl ester carboxylesterase
MSFRWLVLLTFVGVCACSSDERGSPSGSGGSGGVAGAAGAAGSAGAGGTTSTLELVWEPCTLFSNGTGPAAECAFPELPLRHDDPDGPTLDYAVKRYSASGSEPTIQLWMLAGGPGASGMLYEQRAELMVEADPRLEILMPDHRGTGDSSRLSCPDQESTASISSWFIAPQEWAACVTAVQDRWGADLDAFTVTNAANDVGLLVPAAKRPGARVFVHGGSYGTFWGQRYLQMFPTQADGVILDSIVPPNGSLARQDLHADESGADIFQACVDDPGCGPKLDGDPRAFALALYDQLDQGHCPSIQALGAGRVLLRRAFGQMMMTWNARKLIPATLARAARCNADDVSAIETLFDYYFGGGNQGPQGDLLYREWGWVLSNYVAFSEIWETPEITLEQMAAWRDAAAISRDVTTGFEGPLPVMPRYEHDAFYGRFATGPTSPLLMLQGTWDPATRPGPADLVKNTYTASNQHWVTIPRGSHGALGSVPMLDGSSCGTKIFNSFLDAPDSVPDTSCLDQLEAFSFDGSPELNQLLFGVDDAWGGL